MDKNITVTISLSTDGRTAHIGPYFVDVRDTTRDPNPTTAHQMTTCVGNTAKIVEFVGQLKAEGRKHQVRVIIRDTTDAIPL